MKRLQVKITIKELYNKLLTSNVPTYLLSSPDKVNTGVLKTMKPRKESITLMSIFVFWLKNKYLLARKEEKVETSISKEEINNEGIIEKSVDGVVTIKGLKNVKSGEVVMIYNGSKGSYVKALVLNLLAESVQGVLLVVKIYRGHWRYCLNSLVQLVCQILLVNAVMLVLKVIKTVFVFLITESFFYFFKNFDKKKMKQLLLELFASGKNLDGFYAFICKEKNANLIRPFIDSEVMKAFDKSYAKDNFAQKVFPKTFDESVSLCRHILSEMYKTKIVGQVQIPTPHLTHPAFDYLSLTEGISQLKRILNLNENLLNEIISNYADKGIETLRIYSVNVPSELLGERMTSFGMKVIVLEESSILYTEEEYLIFLKNFRRVFDQNPETFENNQKVADSFAKVHNALVLQAKNASECDCILSVDEQKNLEEQQNTAVHFALENYWKTHKQSIIELELTLEDKKK